MGIVFQSTRDFVIIGSVVVYKFYELTCKSCLAASAPALVLNVTNPTGCDNKMINYNFCKAVDFPINSPRLSFHSCWSLSTMILRSLHKLWTISTVHAALRPWVIHLQTVFSPANAKRKPNLESANKKSFLSMSFNQNSIKKHIVVFRLPKKAVFIS